MDKLWAPWRIKYIRSKKEKKCIFCRAKLALPKKHYVIFKTRYAFSILNIYPYNNGHIMVSPLRHVGRLEKLSEEELSDLMKLVIKTKKLLDKLLSPDGYNIGMNISKAAGAGIVGHLHVHIVPRWVGDTNFMPVIHQTKIVSQSLDELYKRLIR